MRHTRWLVGAVATILGLVTVGGSLLAGITLERNRADRLQLVTAALAELFQIELERMVDLGTAVAVALPPVEELTDVTWQGLMGDLQVTERFPEVLGAS